MPAVPAQHSPSRAQPPCSAGAGAQAPAEPGPVRSLAPPRQPAGAERGSVRPDRPYIPARAKFEQQVTLEEFDFTASSKLPAAQIRDLGALRWLHSGESVILFGRSGVVVVTGRDGAAEVSRLVRAGFTGQAEEVHRLGYTAVRRDPEDDSDR
ncbi:MULTISPECIES: ATP-binding protein [unclassified Streptomyces]|uniref:ATP-binding protein n=1 Tax=unclassified Streptomyces TaxID=2593676 RepID=UPI00255667A9|nr:MULTISPECIES: ATP-binding protein [unclassified Streptomyces]